MSRKKINHTRTGTTCVQYVPQVSERQKNYLPFLREKRAEEFNKIREGQPYEILESGEKYVVKVVDRFFEVHADASWCPKGVIRFNDVLLSYVISQVGNKIAECNQTEFGDIFMQSAKSLKGVTPMSEEDKSRLIAARAGGVACDR